jgi:hypothetical protein
MFYDAFQGLTPNSEIHLDPSTSLIETKKPKKELIESDAGYSPAGSLMKIEIRFRQPFLLCPLWGPYRLLLPQS